LHKTVNKEDRHNTVTYQLHRSHHHFCNRIPRILRMKNDTPQAATPRRWSE